MNKRMIPYNKYLKNINYITYGILTVYCDEKGFVLNDALKKNKKQIENLYKLKFDTFMKNVRKMVKGNNDLLDAKNSDKGIVYMINIKKGVLINTNVLKILLTANDPNLLKTYLYLKENVKNNMAIDRADIIKGIGLSEKCENNFQVISNITTYLNDMGLITKNKKCITEIKENNNFQTKHIIEYSLNTEDKYKLENLMLIRNEHIFLDLLEKKLKTFNLEGIRQYKILSYKVDYYIPSLNIAIEYDEYGHRGYSYNRQEGRQKEIEKEIGCKFIRVSSKSSNEENVNKILSFIEKCANIF